MTGTGSMLSFFDRFFIASLALRLVSFTYTIIFIVFFEEKKHDFLFICVLTIHRNDERVVGRISSNDVLSVCELAGCFVEITIFDLTKIYICYKNHKDYEFEFY